MAFFLGLYENVYCLMSMFEHLCRLWVCVRQRCHDCREPQLLQVALQALNIRPAVETAVVCWCKRHFGLLSVFALVKHFVTLHHERCYKNKLYLLTKCNSFISVAATVFVKCDMVLMFWSLWKHCTAHSKHWGAV